MVVEFQVHSAQCLIITIMGYFPWTAARRPLNGQRERVARTGHVYAHQVMSNSLKKSRTFNPFVFSLVIQTQVDGFSVLFFFPLLSPISCDFPLRKTLKYITVAMFVLCRAHYLVLFRWYLS